MNNIHIEKLIKRYPRLSTVSDEIYKAYLIMKHCYENNGKLLIAGNGGSCADAEHMVGELMKNFKLERKPCRNVISKIAEIDKDIATNLLKELQETLPAISLNCNTSLFTAFGNDVDYTAYYAQLIYGYAKENDVFLGISTSGESVNIIKAVLVAKAKGIQVIALTGKKGGRLSELADICVKVPEEDVSYIQELHLPIYHCWCSMLEEYFFSYNIYNTLK